MSLWACGAAAPARGWQVPAPTRSLGRPRALQARSLAARSAGDDAAKVIVIGAGAGGLAAAGRLARRGLDVTVLEKNAEVGGRVQSTATPDGFRHDTGPSLLLFPDKYREAFAAMGTSLEEQGIDLQRVQPTAYRVFFEGGRGGASGPSSLDLLTDEEAMAAQLEVEEPGAAAGYRRFLRMARRHLSMGVPYFIDREFEDLANARGLQDLLPFLPELNVLDLLGQHDWRLKQFFKDPRLRAMFTFQDLYVGLSPYEAPAVFGLLAGTELTDGVWYPLGGFQTVRDGLRRAAESCGARVLTGAEVASIATSAGQSGSGSSQPRVTGVVLADGSRIDADVVLCNRDLASAYKLLEPAHGSSTGNGSSSNGSSGEAAAAAYGRQQHERLGRLKYSAGVIAFNWCLSRQLPGLAHHNVFLSADPKAAWTPATCPRDLPAWPNFYVHVPNRTDPSAAPAGCDSVMVLLPVAHQGLMPCGISGSSSVGDSSSGASSSSGSSGDGGYGPLIEAGRERILAAFAAAGLGNDVGAAIRHERVIAPPEWAERYGLRHGAAFGLSHGLDQLSLFRPANRDPKVSGLYFVGASTRPGNGVPLCFIGAKLTAERVCKDQGVRRVERRERQIGGGCTTLDAE